LLRFREEFGENRADLVDVVQACIDLGSKKKSGVADTLTCPAARISQHLALNRRGQGQRPRLAIL